MKSTCREVKSRHSGGRKPFRSRKWKKSRIVRLIYHLNKKRRSLSPWHMQKGPEAELNRKCLTELEGAHISAQMLYRNAIRTFGSWDKALRACGVEPHLVRRCSRPIRSQPHVVKDLILFLHRKKVCLNYREIDRSPLKIKNILFEGGKLVTSGRSIIRAAERNFGSWQNALVVCGLDPVTFQKQNRKTSNLSIMPHQEEWVEDKNGRRRKQLIYGHSALNPEQLLTTKQNQKTVTKKLKFLSSRKNSLISNILEEIENLDYHDLANCEDIPQLLFVSLKTRYRLEDIRLGFSQLQHDQSLRNTLREAAFTYNH